MKVEAPEKIVTNATEWLAAHPKFTPETSPAAEVAEYVAARLLDLVDGLGKSVMKEVWFRAYQRLAEEQVIDSAG